MIRLDIDSTTYGGVPTDRFALVKNASSGHFSAVDLAAGEVVADVGRGRYPHTATFHPDGRHAYLLYLSSAHLAVLDLPTLEPTATIDDLGTAPVGSTLTPDGDYLFVGTMGDLPGGDGSGVVAHRIGDDAVPERVGSNPLGQCAGMQVGPDGLLYVALKHRDEVVALTPDADLDVVARYPVGAGPHDLYPVPDTDLLAVNNADAAVVSFVATEEGTVTNVETGENPHGIAFAYGDAGRFAVFPAREDTRVAAVDVDALAAGDEPDARFVDVETTTGFAASTPDGRYVVVDSYDASHVTIVEMASMEVAGRVDVEGEPLHVVFSRDGSECYVGNMATSSLAVLDTSSLAADSPEDVTLARRIEGLGEQPSGIFTPEVDG